MADQIDGELLGLINKLNNIQKEVGGGKGSSRPLLFIYYTVIIIIYYHYH